MSLQRKYGLRTQKLSKKLDRKQWCRQKCEVCGHQWNSRVIVTKIMNYIEGHLIILIVTSSFSAFLLNIIAYLYSFHYKCTNSDLKIECHFLITLFTINLLIVVLFILFCTVILSMFIYDFLRPIKNDE